MDRNKFQGIVYSIPYANCGKYISNTGNFQEIFKTHMYIMTKKVLTKALAELATKWSAIRKR